MQGRQSGESESFLNMLMKDLFLIQHFHLKLRQELACLPPCVQLSICLLL